MPSMCWFLLFKKWTKKQKVIGSPVGSFSSNVLDLDIEVVDVICNFQLSWFHNLNKWMEIVH